MSDRIPELRHICFESHAPQRDELRRAAMAPETFSPPEIRERIASDPSCIPDKKMRYSILRLLGSYSAVCRTANKYASWVDELVVELKKAAEFIGVQSDRYERIVASRNRER